MTAPATQSEYSLEEIEQAKRELHERYSREDLLKLKSIADMLRRPMNRKQRRAVAARSRRVGR